MFARRLHFGTARRGAPERRRSADTLGEGPDEARIEHRAGRLLDYLRTLRPHHWVKNALVFAPPLAAHTADPLHYLWAAGAFAVFSLLASSGYVFNDIVDLGHDREHPSKRHRPLAAGNVRLLPIAGVGLGLAIAGLAGSFLVSASMGACAVFYLILAAAYSLWLKRVIVIDVIALASLYVVRVVAGGVAAGIAVSSWLFGFSLFVFLSLAAVKRRKELSNVAEGLQSSVLGRGYVAKDAEAMTMLGAVAAISAAIMLALYAQSPEAATRYDRPELLWLTGPVILYWLGRLLRLANRGAVDDDPVMFAVRDRTSWLAGLLMAAITAMAA